MRLKGWVDPIGKSPVTSQKQSSRQQPMYDTAMVL